jgi:hypothetical protein
MNPQVQQGSAKIYQFPVGGRASLSVRRPEAQPAIAAPRICEAGSSWYHEAAIEDAKRTGEH